MAAVLFADAAADTGTKQLGNSKKKKGTSDPFKGLFHSILISKKSKQPSAKQNSVQQKLAHTDNKSADARFATAKTKTGIIQTKTHRLKNEEPLAGSAKSSDSAVMDKSKVSLETKTAVQAVSATKRSKHDLVSDFQTAGFVTADDAVKRFGELKSPPKKEVADGTVPSSKVLDKHDRPAQVSRGDVHDKKIAKRDELRTNVVRSKMRMQETALVHSKMHDSRSERTGHSQDDNRAKAGLTANSVNTPVNKFQNVGKKGVSTPSPVHLEKHAANESISPGHAQKSASPVKASVITKNDEGQALPNGQMALQTVPAETASAKKSKAHKEVSYRSKRVEASLQSSSASHMQRDQESIEKGHKRKNVGNPDVNGGFVAKGKTNGQSVPVAGMVVEGKKNKTDHFEVQGANRTVSAASGKAEQAVKVPEHSFSKLKKGRFKSDSRHTAGAAELHKHVRSKEHGHTNKTTAAIAEPDAVSTVLVSAPVSKEPAAPQAQPASLMIQDHEAILQNGDKNGDTGDFSSEQHDAQMASRQEEKGVQESQQTFKMQIRLNDVTIHARMRQENLNLMINMKEGHGGIYEQHLGDEIQSILGENGFKSYRLTIKEKSRKLYEYTEKDADVAESIEGQSGVSVKV